MYKRLIALASTVFILFSALTYAEEEALHLSDNIIDMVNGNADYQYNCANELLSAIGIMDGYDEAAYSRYADITRADFAVLTARALNIDFNSTPSGNVFDDVEPEHYAAGSISVLKEMKLINGDGNNCFRPDDTIKLSEAVKMICMGLGYNHYADNIGGYSEGYLTIAIEADLFKNIKITTGDFMTKNEVVLLLSNAMHASIVEMTQSDGNFKYEIASDKSMLTEYHNVYYTEGIIKSNKITDISTPHTSKNNITAGNMSIPCENAEVKQYLGYNARVYYSENNMQEQNVVYIMPKNNNKELKIEGVDADAYYAYAENEIRYYEKNGKLEAAQLEDNFKLIYNGKAEGNYNSILENLDNAHIRLLDNNGNGYYDIVFVTKYQNVVVKDINLINEIIYDLYSSNNNWDYSEVNDGAVVIITDSSGKSMSISDIRPWSVLSISASKDKEYVEVLVNDEYIYGTITQTDGDGKYFINNQEYTMAENFAKYGNQDLYIGLGGSFCLDADGKIAVFIKEDAGALKYGILIKSWYDVNTDIAGIRLYTEDGTVCNFECADKVDIGSSTQKCEKLHDLVKDKYTKLVRYSVNKDGKLNHLEHASAEPDFNENAEYNGFYQYKEESERKYRKTASTFNDDFLINSQTVIFGVFSNYTADNEKYRRMELSALSNDSTYNISAYADTVNPAFAAVVCINFDTDTESFDWSPIAVTGISERMSEDGDVVSELRGYSVDGFVVNETENTSTLSAAGICEGDIIKVKRNSNGQINGVVKLYDSKTKTLTTTASAFNAREGYHLIYPYAISENTLKYTEGDVDEIKKESQLKQKLMNLANVITTNPREGEAYIEGNLNDIVTYTDDISDYSKVFMFSNYAEARLLVIIK